MPASHVDLSAPITGYMYLGCRSDSVKRLQQRLNDKRDVERCRPLLAMAALTVDGAFGALSDSAVRAWQKEARLSADGIVGPLTTSSLGFRNYVQAVQPYSPPSSQWHTGNLVPSGGRGGTTPPPPNPSGRPSPLRDVGVALVSIFSTMLSTVMNGLRAIVAFVDDEVSQAIDTVLRGISNIMRSVGTMIMSVFDRADASLDMMRSVIDNARATIHGGLNTVFGVIRSASVIVHGLLVTIIVPHIVDMLAAVARMAFGVLQGIGGPVGAILAVANDLIGALARKLATLRQQLA